MRHLGKIDLKFTSRKYKYAAFHILFPVFYCVGLSTAFWLARNVIDKNKKIYEIELQILKERLYAAEMEIKYERAEQAALNAQINPHFLYNTRKDW
jgi:sensor histidine kinase YesM